MSADCYAAPHVQAELHSSKKERPVDNIKPKLNTKGDDSDIDQLLEYEKMVFSTQNKSNQLKEQIERIKQFYNNQSESMDPTVKPTRSKSEAADNKRVVSTLAKTPKIIRQNSQAIGTDTSGAALGTIGNILAGITKPIPELYQSKNISKLDINKITGEQIYGVEDVKINTRSKQSVSVKSKSKFRKNKSKIASIASTTNVKKYKKLLTSLEKPIINNGNSPKINSPVTTKRSQKNVFKPRFANRNLTKYAYTTRSKYNERKTDLVEIYHNTAVKESKSSDSDITKKKCNNDNDKPIIEINNMVPPLTIDENDPKVTEPRQAVSCIYKNYTLPTISSRMKRVAKYYMNSFNIKTIPFCLSTSTSASHNIGINIQQVMSMVKSKQPVGRLSPTLAYNIGLAAIKHDDNPIPYLVSAVTSRTFYQNCPLSKSTINYQHLQEIAKTVPQDTIEEIEENEETQSPETQSMIITGPSGDVKVVNRKQTVWSANKNEKKCTCITPKGLGFQQIVNKFNDTAAKPKQMGNVPVLPIISVKSKEQKTDTMGGGESVAKKTSADSMPLQSKEKKLKEVLKKLHDEFEKMTKTYEELAKKTAENNANPDLAKELENLDKELNSKEEEIMMVMNLYKEVVTLKQQVKHLKERASRESIPEKTQISKYSTTKNNITTAGLLNKLLHRVQHFQSHYKKV